MNVQAGPAELGIVLLIGMAILLSIATLVLWVYSLIHAIQNDRLDSTMKLVWVLLIILVSPIGSILYFIIGRNPTGSSSGQYSNGPYGGSGYPPNDYQNH